MDGHSPPVHTVKTSLEGPRYPPASGSQGAALAALIIGGFLTHVLLAVARLDVTVDERQYFGLGKAIIESPGWPDGTARVHPPLAFLVSSLPLLGRPSAGPDDAGALWLSRAASLVVFGPTLLVVVFLWARARHGRAAGLVALTLAAFSPTLLAHSGLITPDLPIAATGVLAMYLFWRSGWAPTWRGAAGWGAALGAALLAKGSGVLFVAAILFCAAMTPRSGRLRPARFLGGLAVAWLVLNTGYGCRGLLDTAGHMPYTGPGSGPERLGLRLAAPFFPPPYLQAAAAQWSMQRRGWGAFLLGRYSDDGFPHYYLVSLALKETLPFLALLAAGLGTLWRKRGSAFDEAALLVPPLLFFGFFSLFGRRQIGIRYILPALPFLFVLASRPACAALGHPAARRALVAALLAAHTGSALRAFPDYISYFNEAAGGPLEGHRHLVDSNLEWGQNRSHVEAYARVRNQLVEPVAAPARGPFIISANSLQGVTGRGRYRVLRELYDPLAVVAPGWLEFDLERKRRFRPGEVVLVASNAQWTASETVESAVLAFPERDPGSALATPLPQDVTGFDAGREYPGTAAVPVWCAGESDGCVLGVRFDVEAAPRQAILHVAAAVRFKLFVNGQPAGAVPVCSTRHVMREFEIAPLLGAGPNLLRFEAGRCGGEAPPGLFAEMHVAGRRTSAEAGWGARLGAGEGSGVAGTAVDKPARLPLACLL